MALPERIFYTMPELAKRWGKTEDDLLHWAAAGVLPLSIMYRETEGVGRVFEGVKPQEYCPIKGEIAKRFLSARNHVRF